MEHSTQHDHFICETCSKIDFDYLLKHPLNSVRDEPNHPGFLLTYTQDCALCKLLLAPPFGSRMLNRDFGLKSFSFLRNSDWASDLVPGAQDSVQLLAVKYGRPFLRRPDHKYIFCTEQAELDAGLFKPRLIQDICDYGLAASWLANCKERHGSLCNEIAPIIEGLQLIDCDQMSVVSAEASSRWTALTYVWGSRTHLRSELESNNTPPPSSHLPADLPRTIKDAISVTKALGYQYLWVDEYCVDQANEAHRDHQISRMDQIYRGADLVLVAAAGQDKTYGLPGVSKPRSNAVEALHHKGKTIFSIGQDPKYHIEHSKWYTRGWIFQEGWLAKRLLVFTDEQMSFYCQRASWMEHLGGPQHIPDTTTTSTTTVRWKSWPVRGSTFQLPLRLYTRKEGYQRLIFFLFTVQKYSVRDLSFEADALRAFAGVMHFLERALSIYNVAGLPYLQGQDDELSLEVQLFSSICWIHSSLPSRRRPMFPSWTWAGWSGGAYWLRFSYRNRPIQTPCLRNARLESLDGEVVAPASLTDSSATGDLQTLLDSIIALLFEVLVVPAGDIAYCKPTTNSHTNNNTLLQLEIRDLFCDGWLAAPYSNLLPNIASGIWSCLFMGTLIGGGNYQRFLLIVEWLDDETAQRIGAFQTHSNDPEEENRSPFEDGLQWRSVRLI
ncbi:Nn.00g059750.m01.CDS01 [Neocucurbitaria sp. VM-36]